jgi:hypothetical protein
MQKVAPTRANAVEIYTNPSFALFETSRDKYGLKFLARKSGVYCGIVAQGTRREHSRTLTLQILSLLPEKTQRMLF